MKKNYYILDGKPAAEKEISLTKLKRGFLYGDGVFETLRAENYRLFRWDDHRERLLKGLDVCHLEIKGGSGRLKNRIEAALKKHKLADAYVRVSVWRRETDSFDPGDERRSNVLVLMKKHHPYPERFYKKGIGCVISKKHFKNEKSPLTHVKSFNYLENLLARIEAKKQGLEETILLNTQGFLASATVSNLFFAKGKTIFTPCVECGILPGITRKVVFEICGRHGIKIKEGRFLPEDLKGFDEVFLTNTLMGVMPVREVKGIFEGKQFPCSSFLRNELKNSTYRRSLRKSSSSSPR